LSNQQSTNKQPEQNKKKANAVLKYSGMAFQMAVIMLGGVFLGKYLDKYFETESAIFTAFLAILSVGVALYITLKDIK
jgi:F0F1-type ATP synthase assembly protein I